MKIQIERRMEMYAQKKGNRDLQIERMMEEYIQKKREMAIQTEAGIEACALKREIDVENCCTAMWEDVHTA